MKKLILTLFTIILLTSCNQRNYEDWTITSKVSNDIGNWCCYYYYYQNNYVFFQDSCNKYNIGDKIK